MDGKYVHEKNSSMNNDLNYDVHLKIGLLITKNYCMGIFWKFIIWSFLDNFKDDFEDNSKCNLKFESISLPNSYLKFPPS